MSKFKFKSSLIAASIFSLSVAFAANAADVVETHQSSNETHTAAPVYAQTTEESSQNFDGVYFGAKVGYDFDSAIKFAVKAPILSSEKAFDIETKGLFAGAVLGFNTEIADRFVVGLEVGGNYLGRETMFYLYSGEEKDATKILKSAAAGATESEKATAAQTAEALNVKVASKYETNYFKIEEKYEANLNVRLAYAITNEFMPYLIAGGNLKSVSLSKSFSGAKTDSEFVFGYNAGAGVDIKLGENAFVRGEYRYENYNPKAFNIYNADLVGAPTFEIGSVTHRASIGIAYKF